MGPEMNMAGQELESPSTHEHVCREIIQNVWKDVTGPQYSFYPGRHSSSRRRWRRWRRWRRCLRQWRFQNALARETSPQGRNTIWSWSKTSDELVENS